MPLSGGSVYMHSLLFFLINTDTCKTLGVRGLGVNWGAAQNTVYSAAAVGADKEAEGLCANSFMKVFAQP